MKLLTADELRKLGWIVRLLDEAYDHYFANGDGWCKSSEGYVHVDFGSYFDRRDGNRGRGVNVYSYVLGPHRTHNFESIDAALTTVQGWHKEEMAYTYDPWRT